MILLVSMRIVENSTYPDRRDALSHDWGAFFQAYGFIPILVPNSLCDVSPYFELGAKGLLLTGGDSLGNIGQPTDRDRTEEALIQHALSRKMPILGVCRGLQMLNRFFAGSQVQTSNGAHVGQHAVRLSTGETLTVNSFHDDVVTTATLSKDLIPFAESDDGAIEAVRHPVHPILGIQWHPERPSPSADYDQHLIQKWKTQCD